MKDSVSAFLAGEIDALGKAKAVLSGVDFSLVQLHSVKLSEVDIFPWTKIPFLLQPQGYLDFKEK